MKKKTSVIMTIALAISAVMIFTACGGAEQPKPQGSGAAEPAATEPATEQGVELMGISKYARTELGVRTEFDVSNHQVNEKGQITQFDLHRTAREKVKSDGALLEVVDTEDSTVSFQYDENGNIISAKTDIPGYGFTMYELTYLDGLIDTKAYSTDWSTVENPYKLQFTYGESDGTVTSSEGKRLEGVKSSYPCEYEYNENGDVTRIIRTAAPDFIVYVDIEYDENGCVTKITSTNPKEVFLVCEFEYTSLGPVGKADTTKNGYGKWQDFSIIEEALKNCY